MSTERPYSPLGVPMPARKRRKVNIFRPTFRAPVHVLIVNARVVTLLRHWGDSKSRAHVEPATACRYCAEGQATIYTGYLGVWCNDAGAYGVVEVTQNALEGCAKLRPESGFDLRGYMLTLRRKHDSPRAPIIGRLSDVRASALITPDGFNTVEAIETIFDAPPGTYRYADDGGYPPLPADPVATEEDPEVAGL